uniref:Uncharacterized protein n=1 Tax=Knipowitschia caucasica TaxID=637954 RepID=A0AAV2LPX9_KNICA
MAVEMWHNRERTSSQSKPAAVTALLAEMRRIRCGLHWHGQDSQGRADGNAFSPNKKDCRVPASRCWVQGGVAMAGVQRLVRTDVGDSEAGWQSDHFISLPRLQITCLCSAVLGGVGGGISGGTLQDPSHNSLK